MNWSKQISNSDLYDSESTFLPTMYTDPRVMLNCRTEFYINGKEMGGNDTSVEV